MTKQNPIDRLFKERLQEHEMQPSAAVWQKVAAAQKSQNSKTSPLFMLRAAAIALLIGISAVVRFSGNQGSLSAYQPLTLHEKGVNLTAQEPLKNTSAPKPQKEAPAQVAKKQNAKRESVTKTPLLAQKQPAKTRLAVVTTNPPEVNEQGLKLDSELPIVGEEATIALAVADENTAPKYSITIRSLPETKGDYSTENSEEGKPELSQKEKLMAYASTQVNRLLAGEKPQLPKTNKTPQLAIAIPKMFK
jgi:hypothetical protein